MDTVATEMIPIRLIICIVITAAIVSVVGMGFHSLSIMVAEHQVEQECRILESTLITMVESGMARDVNAIHVAEGTKRVQTFTLPDSLIYLSFGGDPDPRNDGKWTSELTEDGAAIFYKVQGGNKHIIWLPKDKFKFREGVYGDNKWTMNGEEQSFILNGGGKATVVFELVQKNHINYILIHANKNN